MISQTDATFSAATTTKSATSNLHLHHHHHQQQQHLLQQQQELKESQIDTPQQQQLHHHIPTTTTTHNGKGAKTFSTKKRKKFEETIVDGFAIIAFKTWEDLQDELNSNTTPTFDTTNNNLNADNSKKTDIKNSKTHSTSSSSSTNSLASSNANHSDNHTATSGNKQTKKKDKKKSKEAQFKNHSSSQKDKQRNKSSSEKNSLKRALEAKELAEKRLSILQEKLKQEKNKNKSNSNNSVNINNNNNNNIQNNQHAEPSISSTNNNNQHLYQDNTASLHHQQLHQPPLPPQQQLIKGSALHNQDVHFSSNPHSLTATHIIKEEVHHSQIRSDGLLPPDLLAVQSLATAKSAPFPSFLPVAHPSRPYATNIHQMPVYNPPQSPSTLPHLNQANQAIRQPSKHTMQTQHSSTSLPSHPLMNQHQSTPPPPAPLVPQLTPNQQMHHQYSRPPHPSLLNHPMPYPQAQQSSMLSMGLNTLPSPYSCPPSIYITDTFSRQTSIIPPQPPPPPVLGSVLDPASAASQATRYGHSNVMHSMTPYNPAVTPHHSMYYPTLPTERSFLEFARTYTGPGHIAYPNLMNSFPISTPANPYRFDRWPRAILDQQRAANRYNSLYQSTALPERAYSSYTTTRPPSFPASLFVSTKA